MLYIYHTESIYNCQYVPNYQHNTIYDTDTAILCHHTATRVENGLIIIQSTKQL